MLSYEDVARLLSSRPLLEFLVELIGEIESTYRESELEPIERTGWPRTPDTLELMGCRATDYTCVKLISSNPSSKDTPVPTVTGTMVCTEVGHDQAQLVCDAAVLTALRTAAATAVVMRVVKPRVRRLGIIGAGLEGTAHGVTLGLLVPEVEQIIFVDTVPTHAQKAVREVKTLLGREAEGRAKEIKVSGLAASGILDIAECDAIITATYGQTPVVSDTEPNRLAPGTFIAAVGADLPGKQELDFTVYDHAKFIADDLEQCLREGELAHAAERIRRIESTHRGHSGRLLDGRIIGVGDLLEDSEAFLDRTSEPITVYDSTGFSGQDLALARVLIRWLKESGESAELWNPPEKVSLTKFLSHHT